jgi:hypothetical protein
MDYNTVVRSWKGNALLDLKRIKFIVVYENCIIFIRYST